MSETFKAPGSEQEWQAREDRFEDAESVPLDKIHGLPTRQDNLQEQSQEQHELDKQIEQAERKIGQKVLDRLVNFEDAGFRVVTRKVKKLQEVKAADAENAAMYRQYGEDFSKIAGAKDELKTANIKLNSFHNTGHTSPNSIRYTKALDGVVEAENNLRSTESIDEANARSAEEFYGANKDKLHEAALAEAKTVGVDIKRS